MADSKPYHLMTPAERLAHRIAQNRQIEEKVRQSAPVAQAPKAGKRSNSTDRNSRNDTSSSNNQPSGTGTRVEVTQSFSIRKMGRS